MSEYNNDETRLKGLLIQTEMLAQFRAHPDCLRVHVPEPGCLDLSLDAFPGLVTKGLNPGNFDDLRIPGVDLSYGHISSGGPEGITVRMRYEFPVLNADSAPVSDMSGPPRATTVRMSDMGNRMDAGFHVVRQSMAARVAEFEQAFDAAEAVRRVDALNPLDKKGLSVLARGTARLDETAMARVTREYPHLALAIVENDAMVSRSRAADALLAARRDLEALGALSDVTPQCRKGWAYPLLDPTIYEDGAEGYNLVLVVKVQQRRDGQISRQGVVVNAAGERHSVYDYLVNVGKDNVDIAAGRFFEPTVEAEPDAPRP